MAPVGVGYSTRLLRPPPLPAGAQPSRAHLKTALLAPATMAVTPSPGALGAPARRRPRHLYSVLRDSTYARCGPLAEPAQHCRRRETDQTGKSSGSTVKLAYSRVWLPRALYIRPHVARPPLPRHVSRTANGRTERDLARTGSRGGNTAVRLRRRHPAPDDAVWSRVHDPRYFFHALSHRSPAWSGRPDAHHGATGPDGNAATLRSARWLKALRACIAFGGERLTFPVEIAELEGGAMR